MGRLLIVAPGGTGEAETRNLCFFVSLSLACIVFLLISEMSVSVVMLNGVNPCVGAAAIYQCFC